MGWIYAFLNLFESESFHESYSSGILPGNSTLQLLWKRKVNERVCIGKVGVDLELCVHAHGHDVDPIIEASCNNNCSLDMISSGICVLILCNRGSDHIFSLIPFLKQVKALVFCWPIHLCNLYFDLPSSIALRYLENIKALCCFLWVFI